MKKIKSVKKNGVKFVWQPHLEFWVSEIGNARGVLEYVSEEVILSCPLFEIEYEEEPSELEKFYNTIQGICKDFENKKPGK